MSATCPNGGSYTWRSIIHGRDRLSLGLIWRVGDGASINIYHDRWIPRAGCSTPLGATYCPNITRVADLLNEQGTGWDDRKLEQVLSVGDALDVKQIAIGGPGKEDVRAWNHTKNGQFTVRSAYHLLMAQNPSTTARAGGSAGVLDHRCWLGLWSTSVPNKIKIHIWRLLWNGLAVGDELLRRKIKPGVYCIACGRDETLVHRFWLCPYSVQFWKRMSEAAGAPLITIPPEILDFEPMRVWLMEWLGKAGEEEKAIVFRGCYELWLARNNAREAGRLEDPTLVTERVMRLNEEWKSIHEAEKKMKVKESMQWRPPDEDWIKVNADGAVTKAMEQGGGGAVPRDHHGVFLAGTCHFFPNITDPELSELLACRRALQLAKEVDVHKVILESDSQEVVRKVSAQIRDLSANSMVVHDVKELLESFQEFRVSWVRRSANKVALSFAKVGCSNKICKTWFRVPPEFCNSEVASECIVN